MTEEFRHDFSELCTKYGGLHGVLDRSADSQRDSSVRMVDADRPESAKFYARMAYLLIELRDYWLSR